MTVYMCKENLESILCGVYDAWMSRKGHAQVKLQIVSDGNIELFCEYIEVEETPEKLDKVISAIRSKISEEAWMEVSKAALSQDPLRADKIYRFLIYGFHFGRKVVDMLQIPAVYDLFQLCRNVGNESHYFIEFIRFSEMKEGVLVSHIRPNNDVLAMVAPHFADRLSGENWMIYDERRKKAVIHPADQNWFINEIDDPEWEKRMTEQTDEAVYQELWKAFFTSIAILERKNARCQRNHLPLRYREYMTEFQK